MLPAQLFQAVSQWEAQGINALINGRAQLTQRSVYQAKLVPSCKELCFCRWEVLSQVRVGPAAKQISPARIQSDYRDQALSLKQWVLPDLSQVGHMCTRDSFEKGNTVTLQFWPGPAQPRRPITSQPVPGKYCCTLLIKSGSVIPYSAWSKQWKGLEASNVVSQEPSTVQDYKVVPLLHGFPPILHHILVIIIPASQTISACSLNSSQAIHWWGKVDCILRASIITSSFNHALQ